MFARGKDGARDSPAGQPDGQQGGIADQSAQRAQPLLEWFVQGEDLLPDASCQPLPDTRRVAAPAYDM
ncbi:MAG: hypothetical protein H0X67_17490 [Acidobacteria bacterium]|nr:hypothetical protein [Acidobacteriota bacterium]